MGPAKATQLLTNPLPTVFALYSLLDDLILRYPSIRLHNDVERNAEAEESNYFVEEGAVAGQA